MNPCLQRAEPGCQSGGGRALACNVDVSVGERGGRMWVRAIPGLAGTRTIVIAVDAFDAASVGAFSLTATLATSVAPGGCGTRFDVSRGGTVFGAVPAQSGALSGTCSPGGYMILGEQGVYYAGTPRGMRITGSATGFRPLVTVRDLMNCGNERACAYSGNPSSALTTPQQSGTVVIDGIPTMPVTALYQYAIEAVVQ